MCVWGILSRGASLPPKKRQFHFFVRGKTGLASVFQSEPHCPQECFRKSDKVIYDQKWKNLWYLFLSHIFTTAVKKHCCCSLCCDSNVFPASFYCFIVRWAYQPIWLSLFSFFPIRIFENSWSWPFAFIYSTHPRGFPSLFLLRIDTISNNDSFFYPFALLFSLLLKKKTRKCIFSLGRRGKKLSRNSKYLQRENFQFSSVWEFKWICFSVKVFFKRVAAVRPIFRGGTNFPPLTVRGNDLHNADKSGKLIRVVNLINGIFLLSLLRDGGSIQGD